jgi:hypothetical protein
MPLAENAQTHNTIIAARCRYLLGHNSDWWNFWMLISLGLVAVAAITAVFTTTGVVVSQRREAAQSAKEFEGYKLEAGAKTSAASAHATELGIQLEKAKSELQHELQKTAIAQEATALAQRSLATALEMESSARYSFEAKAAERSIDSFKLAAKIRQFAGTRVLVQYTSNEPEVRRYADEFAVALTSAKWRAPSRPGVPEWSNWVVGASLMTEFEGRPGVPEMFDSGKVFVMVPPKEGNGAANALVGILRDDFHVPTLGLTAVQGAVLLIIGRRDAPPAPMPPPIQNQPINPN